jgi:hypothetical protein
MYVWANGDVYTGEFENDEFHGHGSWSSASGEHYEGGACDILLTCPFGMPLLGVS